MSSWASGCAAAAGRCALKKRAHRRGRRAGCSGAAAPRRPQAPETRGPHARAATATRDRKRKRTSSSSSVARFDDRRRRGGVHEARALRRRGGRLLREQRPRRSTARSPGGACVFAPNEDGRAKARPPHLASRTHCCVRPALPAARVWTHSDVVALLLVCDGDTVSCVSADVRATMDENRCEQASTTRKTMSDDDDDACCLRATRACTCALYLLL
jgi:hypothetical protein